MASRDPKDLLKLFVDRLDKDIHARRNDITSTQESVRGLMGVVRRLLMSRRLVTADELMTLLRTLKALDATYESELRKADEISREVDRWRTDARSALNAQ